MTENLRSAIKTLKEHAYTCVLVSENDTLTFTKRGVSPLLSLLDSGKDYSHYSAADKVVGNGAAYLYLILGIKEIYTSVISEAAYKTLLSGGSEVYFDSCVKYIKNREGNGACPIEQAVADAASPEDALSKIKNKLEELR